MTNDLVLCLLCEVFFFFFFFFFTQSIVDLH